MLDEYLKSIEAEIKYKLHYTQFLVQCIEEIEEEDDPAADMECQKTQGELDEAKKAIEELHAFLGHPAEPHIRPCYLLPPIDFGVGPEGYTEDWAVIDASNFKVIGHSEAPVRRLTSHKSLRVSYYPLSIPGSI